MIDASQIQEHMDIICADGQDHGQVDHVEGNYIKLTRRSSSDGQHHWLPISVVDRVDQHVHLTLKHAEVQDALLDQDPNQAVRM